MRSAGYRFCQVRSGPVFFLKKRPTKIIPVFFFQTKDHSMDRTGPKIYYKKCFLLFVTINLNKFINYLIKTSYNIY